MCNVPRPTAPLAHITIVVQTIAHPEIQNNQRKKVIAGIIAALILTFFLIMFRFWM